MSKKISYDAMLRQKPLSYFSHLEERRCPNCGFIDQEPKYSNTCLECGHIK